MNLWPIYANSCSFITAFSCLSCPCNAHWHPNLYLWPYNKDLPPKIRKKPEKSPIFFKIYPLLKNLKLNYSSTLLPPALKPETIYLRTVKKRLGQECYCLLEMLKRIDYWWLIFGSAYGNTGYNRWGLLAIQSTFGRFSWQRGLKVYYIDITISCRFQRTKRRKDYANSFVWVSTALTTVVSLAHQVGYKY